jgi:hypothetical protein
MTRLDGGKTRDGWGVFDRSSFKLEDSPYRMQGTIPFTICDLAGAAIALVVEQPRTVELRKQLAEAARPEWIDAVGQTTLASQQDEVTACIEADLIAPEDFDPSTFALASAIVLYSHGMFTREPETYRVRVRDRIFEFEMTFDDDTESWSADVIERTDAS